LLNRYPGTVAGMKDSSGSFENMAGAAKRFPGFEVFSGDDTLFYPLLKEGGVGCISVSANVAPALCARLQDATRQGAYELAREIDDLLAPLHKAMFVEPSPAPAKYACSLLGLCSDEVRLPLLACSDGAKAQIRAAMTHAGLI